MSKDFNDFMNTQDDSMLYDTQDVQNNKIWAALSYVGILFILPLLGRILPALLSLAILALIIIGILNAANGKAKQLPLIGNLLHVFDK